MKGEGKLGEMVLYIVGRCGGRRNFGRVMLCRLCYFSDFGNYELRGASISGSEYVLRNGGPEPSRIDILLEELVREKALRIAFHHGSEAYSIHSAPRLSLLTPQEISAIDHAIADYGWMSDRIVSWMSREDAPCVGRRPSEVIDYSAVRLRDGRTSAAGWASA